ncbi:MAG TPA: DUF4245 domain-containing protein [Terrimesophilobacter sp.]|nr:DUF4245 domain-containing protein [Terrimesophilobacter sp.]
MTPEETAQLKAEAAQKRRSRQTTTNLLLSLAACLAVVFAVILVAVRPTAPNLPEVDYVSVARQAQSGIVAPLAAPRLTGDWAANAAQVNPESPDGVVSWYIGFLTPDDQFIGMRQGVGADRSWIANQLPGARPTGTAVVDGVPWKVYDRRDARDPGNFAYAMSTTSGSSAYVLFGTAKTAEFHELATALATQLDTTGKAPQ